MILIQQLCVCLVQEQDDRQERSTRRTEAEDTLDLMNNEVS